MTVYLWMPYMLMLVSITLTMMQGHSGSAKAKNQRCMLSATKQAIRIKLSTTVGLFFFLRDFDLSNVYMACPTWFLLLLSIFLSSFFLSFFLCLPSFFLHLLIFPRLWLYLDKLLIEPKPVGRLVWAWIVKRWPTWLSSISYRLCTFPNKITGCQKQIGDVLIADDIRAVIARFERAMSPLSPLPWQRKLQPSRFCRGPAFVDLSRSWQAIYSAFYLWVSFYLLLLPFSFQWLNKKSKTILYCLYFKQRKMFWEIKFDLREGGSWMRLAHI